MPCLSLFYVTPCWNSGLSLGTLLPHGPTVLLRLEQTRGHTRTHEDGVRTVNMWLVFYSCKHHVTFSCVNQSECTRLRPVIGLVACHSKCSQPIRGGAPETGERTWTHTLQQFVHFTPLIHHLRDQHLTVPQRCKGWSGDLLYRSNVAGSAQLRIITYNIITCVTHVNCPLYIVVI